MTIKEITIKTGKRWNRITIKQFIIGKTIRN